ncbi:DUF4262 domain-containing protein [Gandjariella thermophila]|uniref:DUF4262 domain-containing protein n=1 Tax=Gandjariella thermophila TaxID=1931992 RepID=A0A4D4J0Y7_9PSEU|nr:hypothetical protein GTS_04330 [Gandjariella thermophila]
MATTQGLSAEHERLRRELLRDIEEHGHAVVHVAEDDQGAPYSFTVGAWRRFGVAEAVVVGLPAEMAGVLLAAYVSRARGGERFLPGKLYHGIFQDVPITVERVAKGHYLEFFGGAFLIYRKGDFPALQLIVPTPDGHWPWHPDAPEGFAEWQPVLTQSGLPESWAPGIGGP